MQIHIKRRDGTKLPFDADKINRSIERATAGLQDPISLVTQIATETRVTLYDGITTEELDQATISATIQNIKDDVQYDKVATRLFLKTIYRRVIGEYDKDSAVELRKRHRTYFPKYIKEMIAAGRLDKRMADKGDSPDGKFDLEKLAGTLNLERDELFQYAGVMTTATLYLLRDQQQEFVETPQIFFMRVAMGLAFNESDPTAWAIKFYHKMSKLEYIAGSSTNLGAGTSMPALSNCYLLEVHDDMGNISKSVSDVMMLSKGSGGMGVSITKLRASGSPLKSTNGVSSGPAPFAKIMDTAIDAIMRAGKRKGALCFYMENWHIDFPEYLNWKHNAGDERLRMRTANTAAFISDEFMNRVLARDDWYMFDPAETPDLGELYGLAFSKRYKEYAAMADQGKMRTYKKVPAAELYRQMVVSLQTTSHPWQVWKDAINVRALNNNMGTIHMSNLCTEICLPQDRNNVAVCNLASLNLATHVANKEVQWQKLEESTRLAIRQLDNLVDINLLPIPEARKSDSENRAIGLGVMGLADVFEKLGLSYESEAAYNFTDKVFEFVSYIAIDESANLAVERGSYTNFKGSEWSKGLVPIDTLEILDKERGQAVTVYKAGRNKGLNWDLLREKVKKGIRNSTLMAVAPNATIGLVAGTVPGIDARFAQVFSRNTLSGKYLDINHNLVKDLSNLGIWEEVREQIIANQGNIADIKAIPDHIKEVYKTSFTTSPYAYIEVAARAQKWVDQALSRNMYLETRDIDETMKVYEEAWRKGLKSTYYLHMKPRHTAEQSTIKVNKQELTGKRGFGVLTASPLVAKVEEPVVVVAPVQTTIESTPTPLPTPSPMAEAEQPVAAQVQAPAKSKKKGDDGPSDPADLNVCISCQ